MEVKEVTISANIKRSDDKYGSVGIALTKTITVSKDDNVDMLLAIEREELYNECDKFIKEKLDNG